MIALWLLLADSHTWYLLYVFAKRTGQGKVRRSKQISISYHYGLFHRIWLLNDTTVLNCSLFAFSHYSKMRYILNWPIINFSWTSFRIWPLASLLSSPGSIFQQCLAFAKVVSKRVESVLSGRSDALQRRLIVLPWNSHLIAPLSTSRWLCRFARTKHLFFVKGLFR